MTDRKLKALNSRHQFTPHPEARESDPLQVCVLCGYTDQGHTPAQRCATCTTRCCREHRTHTMPHIGCVLR